MRLTHIAEDRETAETPDLEAALKEYDERDSRRVALWTDRFQ